MSKAFAAAERVSVWTKAGTPAPFVAWGDALRTAFEPPVDEMPIPEDAPLDIEAMQNDAYALGYAEGLAAGRAEAETEKAALAKLAAALDVLRPEPTQALGGLIAATVERLVGEIVGAVAIDTATLVARAEAAAALIGEETRPALLRLNPADHARLEGVALPVPTVADPAVGLGALRLETGSGWIEDSPQRRLDTLRAALDRVAVAK